MESGQASASNKYNIQFDEENVFVLHGKQWSLLPASQYIIPRMPIWARNLQSGIWVRILCFFSKTSVKYGDIRRKKLFIYLFWNKECAKWR